MREAHKEGNVAKSQDIGSAAILLSGIVMLLILGPMMIDKIQWMFKAIYAGIPTFDLNSQSIPAYFTVGAKFMAKLLAPFALSLALIGLLAQILQIGFVFTAKPLEPKLDKLSPKSNLKKTMGSRGLVELAKGLVKITIVIWIGYLTMRGEIPKFVMLIDQDVPAIISTIGNAAAKLGLRVAIAILIMAIFDLLYQRWKHTQDLKMTKQEVKDEHKQSEGDPQVKSRIRQIQMKTSLNRMISNIPEADAIVTNPTHVAVALKYDPETMKAPRVIAKGMRKLALRIKKIAEEHDIPIIEEPELARALYKSTEIGWEVPYELYQAVAEILALVYRIKESVMR